MLKIALLGAPHTGKSLLASGLTNAAKAGAWPARIVVLQPDDSPALPADAPAYDLVLLTGLEAATGPSPEASQAPAQQRAQETADSAIRATLAGAKISYRVLYGRSEERLAQACAALQGLLPPAEAPTQADLVRARKKPAPWVWLCDKCSDPQCEHRLLTALLAERARRA